MTPTYCDTLIKCSLDVIAAIECETWYEVFMMVIQDKLWNSWFGL